MPLPPSTKLGPYEVLAQIGQGGMGEVYRAVDTRLGRTVAIKVLPEQFSSQADWRERFEREARAVSALNHPNICALYDVGHQDGADFLVMEFIEGETLAARLNRGALALEEAVRMGIEVAGALATAHRHGIIHCDLKPSNIMRTKSGVKLLDFGLAKAMPRPAVDANLSDAPTASGPLDAHGRILGTLPYMSPEQVEGKEADPRSDIFAFGALLYEMTTGRKAFQGSSPAGLVAAIIEHDPLPMTQFQPKTPLPLERIITMCLAKDPEERWQTAHDIELELKWVQEGVTQVGLPVPAVHRRERLNVAPWALAALLAIATLSMAVVYFRATHTVGPVVVSSILPPPGTQFSFVGARSGVPKISPDARMLLFVALDSEGRTLLWVRPLASASALALSGTEGAEKPFWSADSRSIGFFANGKLKTILASGGPVSSLCNVAFASGGSWNRQGTILFVPQFASGVYQISATGGAPKLVVSFDKTRFSTYAWPNFLPDGEHFTFYAADSEVNSGIYFASLEGGNAKLAVRSTGNSVFSSGFLFYSMRTGASASLMRLAFDPTTGIVKGEPEMVMQGLAFQFQPGAVQSAFDVSDAGLLAYQASPTLATAPSNFMWLDRSGKDLSAVETGPDAFDLRLSPDGQRVAYSRGNPNSDIWVDDLKRGIHMRLTFDPSADKGAPTWSPDGDEILFDVTTGGSRHPGIYGKSSSGAGDEVLLVPSDNPNMMIWPTDWSPDGRFVLYVQGDEIASCNQGDVWVLPMSDDRKPRVFIRSHGAAYDAQFSPDGRWVAYTSRESGQEEVYVVPFAAAQVLKTPPSQDVGITGKWQVSTNGGAYPRWRGDGKELFYTSPRNELIAVQVAAKEDTFSIGDRRTLFRETLANVAFPYDVSPDGQRFMVNSFGEIKNTPITLVHNWRALLANR
jgi:eukaryotic-like serine/threonine-protein kinase